MLLELIIDDRDEEYWCPTCIEGMIALIDRYPIVFTTDSYYQDNDVSLYMSLFHPSYKWQRRGREIVHLPPIDDKKNTTRRLPSKCYLYPLTPPSCPSCGSILRPNEETIKLEQRGRSIKGQETAICEPGQALGCDPCEYYILAADIEDRRSYNQDQRPGVTIYQGKESEPSQLRYLAEGLQSQD